MARRSNTPKNPTDQSEATPESTDETVAAENTEESAPAESTEQVEESTEQADTKTEQAPADLTDFKAAVEAAVAERDTSTGEVPEGEITKVNEQYRSIDGIKGKNQARNYLDDLMKEALVERQDMQLARAYVMLKDNLSAGPGGGPKAPSDPTQAFVQKLLALTLATNLVQSDVPEGVSEDWNTKFEALKDELEPQVKAYADWQNNEDEDVEAPEVSPVVRQAFKLSQGKTPGGSGRVSGGPRRDIEKHLQQVFEDLEVGAFLTVNEIAKTASTEYGDDRPSAGAVSARLFKKDGTLYEAGGIRAVNDGERSRGAEKIDA